MRQYVVDELRPQEIQRIKSYLDNACEASALGGVYWLRIPEDILSSTQFEHKSCWPHCCAIEIGDSWVKFEMLIRSRQKIRCECVRMATSQQRSFILSFVDKLIEELDIRV